VYLRRCHGGQGGPGITGGKESHERSISPAATLDQIPATAGLGVEGGRLGKLPGGTVKLLRALARAGMHRSGRPMTEQRCCTAEQAAGGAGDSGGCSAVVGHKEGLREGLQGPNKEEAGGLGVRVPVEIAAVIRAGEADRATAQRDPGSGKETSGRRVHTGDWPMGSCSVAGWSGATCSDGTAGRNRGSRRGEEEGKEGDGHRQVGSSWGND
jgi:hypothetical protein